MQTLWSVPQRKCYQMFSPLNLEQVRIQRLQKLQSPVQLCAVEVYYSDMEQFGIYIHVFGLLPRM